MVLASERVRDTQKLRDRELHMRPSFWTRTALLLHLASIKSPGHGRRLPMASTRFGEAVQLHKLFHEDDGR